MAWCVQLECVCRKEVLFFFFSMSCSSTESPLSSFVGLWLRSELMLVNFALDSCPNSGIDFVPSNDDNKNVDKTNNTYSTAYGIGSPPPSSLCITTRTQFACTTSPPTYTRTPSPKFSLHTQREKSRVQRAAVSYQ
jgi:hypothetical protein